jgi:hypothetical protein
MKRKSWGFSLFCDDIRAEVGGKISVMGIYQNDMIFPQDPPFNLPKFAILVKYFELPDAFHEDITVNVYLPGDQKDSPTVTLPVPRKTLQTGEPPPYELEEGQERVFNLTLPIAFSPLLVGKEGFIKVRATCGDVVTNLGSLMLRKIRQEEKIPGFNA